MTLSMKCYRGINYKIEGFLNHQKDNYSHRQINISTRKQNLGKTLDKQVKDPYDQNLKYWKKNFKKSSEDRNICHAPGLVVLT